MENIFGIYNKYWQKNQGQGAHTLSTRVGGTPAPLGAPPALWAPWDSTDLNCNSIYSCSGRKKIREKDSSRFTIRSRRQALKPLGRADRSPFGAPKRGIRRHRHHQPSSITNFMMLTAVRE